MVYNVKSGGSGRRVTVYRFAGKLTSGSGDKNFVSARYSYYCTYISYSYIYTYTTGIRPVYDACAEKYHRLHPCQQSR